MQSEAAFLFFRFFRLTSCDPQQTDHAVHFLDPFKR